jgi:hypothetical protein
MKLQIVKVLRGLQPEVANQQQLNSRNEHNVFCYWDEHLCRIRCDHWAKRNRWWRRQQRRVMQGITWSEAATRPCCMRDWRRSYHWRRCNRRRCRRYRSSPSHRNNCHLLRNHGLPRRRWFQARKRRRSHGFRRGAVGDPRCGGDGRAMGFAGGGGRLARRWFSEGGVWLAREVDKDRGGWSEVGKRARWGLLVVLDQVGGSWARWGGGGSVHRQTKMHPGAS